MEGIIRWRKVGVWLGRGGGWIKAGRGEEEDGWMEGGRGEMEGWRVDCRRGGGEGKKGEWIVGGGWRRKEGGVGCTRGVSGEGIRAIHRQEVQSDVIIINRQVGAKGLILGELGLGEMGIRQTGVGIVRKSQTEYRLMRYYTDEPNRLC